MRRLTTTLVLFCLITLLSGCWDSVEIEDQYLVWAMGWDTAEENEKQMLLSLTSPTTVEGAPELSSVVTVAGYSVEDAILNAQEITFRTIELGHLQVLMMDEEFAKKGIQKHLDSLGRNPRIGRETLIVVGETHPTTFWKAEFPATPRPAEFLVNILQNNARVSDSVESTFRDFFESLSREGVEPVTAYVRLTSDKKGINSAGLAAFHKANMVGKLLGDDVQCYLLLAGKSKSGDITLGQATAGPEDHSTVFRYRRSETEIKTKVIDEEPHIYVNISLEGDIVEYTRQAPINEASEINKAEAALAEAETHRLQRLVDRVQNEFRSDIFGFGEYFRAYHSKWWKKHNWDEEFPDAEVHITVEVEIRRIGIES